MRNAPLTALKELQIETVNLSETGVGDAIQDCYEAFDNVNKVGATITSKLLHILQPKLFVMWDTPILEHYHKKDPQVTSSKDGYLRFLQKMQEMANAVGESFCSAVKNPPAEAGEAPASYLSKQLGCDPPKTMAKYLDEYNWVKITHKVQLPPSWHP